MKKWLGFGHMIILLGIFNLLSGCATLSPKQEGHLTSTPPGANVFFYEPATNKKSPIGQTPGNAWCKQGIIDAYIVAEFDGYETEEWPLPKSGRIDHHFNLTKDLVSRIRNERDSFDKEFQKRVVDVIGRCDKVLNSPRMLSGSVASEAQTEYQKLRIDYPQFKDSSVNEGLLRLLDKVDRVSSLPKAYYNTTIEQNLVKEIQTLIIKIKIGLGI